jgi:hypothetical protein
MGKAVIVEAGDPPQAENPAQGVRAKAHHCHEQFG